MVAGRWLHEGYRERMTALTDELGLDGRVEFAGEQSEEAMGNLAAGAVCSVTLNAELGFGMPALEAAAQGCTFVCPRVAGVTSHFRDGVEAFYFDEGDSEGLARILKRLVDEPRLAHRAGLAAWERARTSLTWRHHATAIATAVAMVPATGCRKYRKALPVQNMTTARSVSRPAPSSAAPSTGLRRARRHSKPA